MIISVPKSWNLSQRSLVSRWQSTVSNSSQLQRTFGPFGFVFSGSKSSGDSRSFSGGSEPHSEMTGDCRNEDLLLLPTLEDDSPSEHSSTSTSMSSSSKGSSETGELSLDR